MPKIKPTIAEIKTTKISPKIFQVVKKSEKLKIPVIKKINIMITEKSAFKIAALIRLSLEISINGLLREN